MGKSLNGKITERQLRMTEMRAEGKTLDEVGSAFGITGSGARVNINYAVSKITKHGLSAVLPEGCTPKYTQEQLLDLLPVKQKGPAGPTLSEQMKEPVLHDQFLRIKGIDFSLDEVTKALGFGPTHIDPSDIMLCQRVDAGILSSRLIDWDGEYPGIDTELYPAGVPHQEPIYISRTEQPRAEDEELALRTFGYGRDGDYFLFFDTDTRTDEEIGHSVVPPEVTLGGNPGSNVKVFTENNYIDFRGASEVFTSAPRQDPDFDLFKQDLYAHIANLSASNFLNSEDFTYLKSHLDEVTKDFVDAKTKWEAANRRSIPFPMRDDMMHGAILNKLALQRIPTKESLDTQIKAAAGKVAEGAVKETERIPEPQR